MPGVGGEGSGSVVDSQVWALDAAWERPGPQIPHGWVFCLSLHSPALLAAWMLLKFWMFPIGWGH